MKIRLTIFIDILSTLEGIDFTFLLCMPQKQPIFLVCCIMLIMKRIKKPSKIENYKTNLVIVNIYLNATEREISETLREWCRLHHQSPIISPLQTLFIYVDDFF